MEAVLDKAALRSQFVARRRALAPSDLADKSQRIAQQLIALPHYAQAACVALYHATSHEVTTTEIFAHACAHGKCVALPRVCDVEQRTMSFHTITDLAALAPGYRNILEPNATAAVCARESIDLICVPGVGFDATGHRLGMGAGFYDAWLAGFAGVRVGLAFDCQMVESLGAASNDPWDEAVDIVITESRTTMCRRAA